MSYIGFVTCEGCGLVNVEDASLITVWYTMDNEDEQLCDVACPKCSSVISDTISDQVATLFKSESCNWLDYGDKFEPLTERMIDEWDIGAELDQLEVA